MRRIPDDSPPLIQVHLPGSPDGTFKPLTVAPVPSSVRFDPTTSEIEAAIRIAPVIIAINNENGNRHLLWGEAAYKDMRAGGPRVKTSVFHVQDTTALHDFAAIMRRVKESEA